MNQKFALSTLYALQSKDYSCGTCAQKQHLHKLNRTLQADKYLLAVIYISCCNRKRFSS
jgi:hypothetical protein